MKATTAIGIVVAILGLFVGMLMEGGNPAAFLNLPALIIIVAGTVGATLAGTSIDRVKTWPTLWKKAFGGEKPDLQAEVDRMVEFAEKARREGLLALENEIDGMAARHKLMVQPFEKAGGFAPTMGIIGTVMGLVHVLENLDRPETLGPAISGAFIATLYGVASANVLFLPAANRLKLLSEEEQEARMLTLEGILAIQAGDNPRVVADKLLSFVPPADRIPEGQAVPQPEPAVAAA